MLSNAYSKQSLIFWMKKIFSVGRYYMTFKTRNL